MKSLLRFSHGLMCIATALAIASAASAQDSKQKPKEDNKQPEAKKADAKEPAKADDGQAQILQAYEISKTAETAKEPAQEFSKMIELCEKGLAGNVSPAYKTYGQKLAAFAHFKRGEEYGKSAKDKEALADFEAAAKYLADVPARERPSWEYELLHQRGVSHATLGELDKALADFNRVLEMRPNYGKVYFNRGEIYYSKGDPAKAIAEYGQAIRYGYPDSVVYTRRGATYWEQGDANRALADYNQAIARNSGDYEALTLRGEAHYAGGRPAEALRDYQRAMTLNGKYPFVFQSAAWLRATSSTAQYRNAESALRNAQRAIELGGDGARFWRTLAAAQARNGQFAEAIDTAKKALEKAKGAKDQQTEEELLNRMLESFQQKKTYESRAATPKPQEKPPMRDPQGEKKT
jgi:tetratricopeptide (TPR) repeat protein